MQTRMNRYLLTLFLRDEETDLYERFDELHEQRAWSAEEIRRAAADAGMDVVKFADGAGDPISEKTERIYAVLREKGKQK